MFMGNQNSGKTMGMTYFCNMYYHRGYKIYSNYNLSIPHEKITKEMLTEYTKSRQQFEKTVFAIDEIYLFFDSRSSASKDNKLFSYFVTQTSKNDVVLLGTAQFFNTIEKRIRENTNNIIYCSRVLKTKKGFRVIKKNIRFLSDDMNESLYIKVLMMRKIIDGLNEDMIKKTLFLKAKPIFQMYNTKELIDIE